MDNTFLIFTVGKLNFAIDIADVKEVISVGEITKLPKSTSNISGITNYRGEIIGILNLNVLFNEMPTPSLKRIIVTETVENKIGLMIDSATKFLKIPDTVQLKSFQTDDINLTQLWSGGKIQAIVKKLAKGIYETKEGIFYVIDANKLVENDLES
ncbi:MAG: chemotaxis protein CheW [Candidatus Firestonebacteria bacterium]